MQEAVVERSEHEHGYEYSGSGLGSGERIGSCQFGNDIGF
jgi:hypothetical protein